MLCLIFIIILTISLHEVESLFYNDLGDDVRHGSCRFRSVRQAEFNWNSPERSMSESFVLDDVEYKLCRYHVTWDEALVFCSNHQSHLATLDSEEKTAFVIEAIASSSSASEDYWIGARKLYDGPWKWNSNDLMLNSGKDIMSKPPIRYPGYESNNIHCLTIDRSGHNDAIFVPRPCNQRRGFVCQRDANRAFDSKLRMVAATRIDNHEFRLYAGRATWAEAVVQCREDGLQIAEVNTAQEAQALAILMLRNRPEGIESTWIGGYTRKDDPSTWHWLGSGEKIENPDMWRRNTSEIFGGCLLLDRHVCESPVYVESTCDRKRDVLCQKPPAKRLNKNPVPVFVDDCFYWIGFYPSTWSDARSSCESLNATLVALNSPATISHMMSLMLDNKAELHHIWIDGRRSKIDGQWKWVATDENIPDFGKSFVPWCSEDDYNARESDCLNLDRENLDTPLVYGLSCREKQTYVCQPRVGDCVFHSTPKMLTVSATDVDEEIPEATSESPPLLYQEMATQSLSTVTTSYPTRNLNDATIQTTLRSGGDDLGDLVAWESGQRAAGKNSSSHNFDQYLKPFSRFTLPSLPQFGIKVVSAAEATTNSPSFEMKKKKNKAYQFLTTSSYVSSVTVVPPSFSSPSSIRKSASDARKAGKLAAKSPNVLATSNLSDFLETTISSISTDSRTEKFTRVGNSTRPAYTQISPSIKSHFGSKNSSRSSKASKITTRPSSSLDELLSTSDVDRTKEYSIKTTRDLNYSSNATKITSTTTSAPEIPSATNLKTVQSDFKEFRQRPKPILIDTFSLKGSRPNSTLVARRKQNFRVTTEATTPYDAIDEDYYDDEKDDRSAKNFADEDDEDAEEADEYSEDYVETSISKSQTKKKAKTTTNSGLRKNPPKPIAAKEDEEEEEEMKDDEVQEETTKYSLPLASELSKNLEDALVHMMTQGVEKSKNEKAASAPTMTQMERKSSQAENVPWVKNTAEENPAANAMKHPKLDNVSLRPYYAFEGPMIVDLSENPNLGQGAERTGGDGNVREFKFVGKKLNSENFSGIRRPEARRISGKETRRQMKPDPPNHRSSASDLPLSMSGMPPIRPNDPNSLVQLGRYFKNQFRGFAQNSAGEDRRPLLTNSREEMDQRRYGPLGINPYSLERPRGYPGSREEDTGRKGQRWEKPRRPGIREPRINNYDRTRRLYPRENYDVYGSPGQPGEIKNEGSLTEQQERLGVAWPGKNVSNYENIAEVDPAVSPRSFPVPVRTTRSFHQEAEVRKLDSAKRRVVSDFRLSKLVKEVKIDLDQRMLRRYLEGFARKIAKKNPAARGDDWKDTWRQLLGQMLSVLDKMNINVNGDLMKLRVGTGDANNFSSLLGNSQILGWKSGLRKQRTNSPKVDEKKRPNQLKKKNETLQRNSSRNSTDSPQTKNQEKSHSKNEFKIETNDGHRNINSNRDSVTKSPLGEEKKKQTALPGRYMNYKTFEDKSSLNRQEMTDRPTVGHRENSRHIVNRFHPKYSNFNNQTVRRPQFPVARLSTVFGYRSLMPQLHHRIIFQPGWGQIRDNSGPQKAFFNDRYLPKGSHSKLVDNAMKPEHFEANKNDAVATGKPDIDGHGKRPKNSFGEETNAKSETQWKINESGRNKLKNEDLSGYYNVTYVEQFKDRKKDEEEMSGRDEEIVEEERNAPEDYERKPTWLPAHRLSKALELSVLKKFGASPSNSLRTKNLVTRSVKEIEANRQTKIPEIVKRNDGYNLEENLERNLDELDAEPSIVSLRMIMDPEAKYSRILRQSQDSRVVKPRTVELRVQFSGKESTTTTTERISSQNNLIKSEIKNLDFPMNNQSLRKDFGTLDPVANAKDKNSNSSFVTKRPIRFIDKERRRATINRLRERSRNIKRNYIRSFAAAHRQNRTAIGDPRDRKSRNIGAAKKNSLGDVKASKEIQAKHFIATSLRGFEDKNLTNRGGAKWRKGGNSYGNDLGIDWAQQASALFADVKETSGDLTLYIDLTLSRVGSKPRQAGRSKA